MATTLIDDSAELKVVAPAIPTLGHTREFPIFAMIAPVVVSVAMWVITQSIFALLFAALGPVVAGASVVDNRLGSRRTFRVDAKSFAGEIAAAHFEISALHKRERRSLELHFPSSSRLVSAVKHDAVRWQCAEQDRGMVMVGHGMQPSRVRVEGGMPSRSIPSNFRAELEGLRKHAAELSQCHLAVDASAGIGICGQRSARAATARSAILQLAATLSPRQFVVEVGEDAGGESWLSNIPHTKLTGQLPGVRFRPAGPATEATYAVVTAESRAALPTNFGVVIEANGLTGNVSWSGGRTAIVLEQISHQEAASWAVIASSIAEREGSGASDSRIPESCTFDRLVLVDEPRLRRGTVPDERGTLSCTFAESANGPELLDLVADGPHAIVGGMTGSGKSELLIAWVLAMAHSYPPHAVNFLLVDFKGGSAFAELRALRHCVGMISDLDARLAERALVSLTAELRHRERELLRSAVRTIDELPADRAFPRLVIVVDEFAAMATEFPDLNVLFADIAARGRSLGIHLILCTQRPSGVIREAILANAALRISLRVNNTADSNAVIGTDNAAALSADSRGRGFVLRAAGLAQLQFAIADSRDIRTVASAWNDSTVVPRRPWLDPLPEVVTLASLSSGSTKGIPLGRSDSPQEQAQPIARYSPDDGHLLVVGGARSGKTALLSTLRRSLGSVSAQLAPAEIVPSDSEGAWDALHRLAESSSADSNGERIVLFDNVDAAVARFADEYQTAFLELLGRLLRDGSARGIRFVLTTQRITANLQSIASLCQSRLILRMPNRQEHVLAGGSSADYRSDLTPGATVWCGLPTQIAFAGLDEPVITPEVPTIFHPRGTTLVVSTQPRAFTQRLRKTPDFVTVPNQVVELEPSRQSDPRDLLQATSERMLVFVADAETWQFHLGALAALKGQSVLLFDRCSLSEFRTLTRIRALPPPLANPAETLWLCEPDGSLSRARLASANQVNERDGPPPA